MGGPHALLELLASPNLRSRAWFDNPDNPDMTALYLQRYLNFGLTREELRSVMPPGGGRNAVDCALWELEAAREIVRQRRRASAWSAKFSWERKMSTDNR